MNYVDALRRIHIRCSEFLEIGHPLYKMMSGGDPIKRVKVRVRSTAVVPPINVLMGEAVAERSVRVTTAVVEQHNDLVPHYVFPTNGFKVIWTPSTSDVLSMTDGPIRTRDLSMACVLERDVVLYGIQDFYTVRVDACSSFANLMEAINASGVEPM